VLRRLDLLQDTRFNSAALRNKNRKALDEIVASWTRLYTLRELEEKLHAAQVPATRIFTLQDIFQDPHYRARETIVKVPDEGLGEVALSAVVPRLSATPGSIRHSGRRVGEDTAAVLSALAGLTHQDLERLKALKVIYTGEDASDAESETQVSRKDYRQLQVRHRAGHY